MSNYTISSFTSYIIKNYKQGQLNELSLHDQAQFKSIYIETQCSTDDLFIFKNDIQAIICDVLNVDKTYLYLNSDKILDDYIVKRIDTEIYRYLSGEPLAYILGYKYFWEQKLFVTQDTLIPRADTEVLIEAVLGDVSNKDTKLNILDLGTGTGAIALALASELPKSQVIAVDFSNKALDIAKKNAKENKISNVEFIQSDWYENMGSRRFDIIVSNSPYIDFDDENITQEVKKHEPQSALFSKDNGLADIKTIVSQSPLHLNTNGHIYIEHGLNQANDVANILKFSQFIKIETTKDLNNKDRCTHAIFNKNLI
ncbi:release factor glutamine methyltransferase [Francisella halioticida]|uniref:Release factor glutamine methyltransferase n=1 Tax=Francisella halioticida TaxID=549298 RepID=A0ABM6M1L9_9GAMM|nr:peptide chain release factor N(5)-glutamine methyltransferase [Francisella halioticida]ASG68737.1 protein-(glutamine-N5) methyltransferase, release factor-specific [Francisella halioticida]BCD91690.1 release factor glutamine methyltransferase [Francisella halioticida]